MQVRRPCGRSGFGGPHAPRPPPHEPRPPPHAPRCARERIQPGCRSAPRTRRTGRRRVCERGCCAAAACIHEPGPPRSRARAKPQPPPRRRAHTASQPQIRTPRHLFFNVVKSGFEVCFGYKNIGSQHRWCRGSQTKTRLESSTKKFRSHLISRPPRSPQLRGKKERPVAVDLIACTVRAT